MKEDNLPTRQMPSLLRVDRACQVLDISRARFYELVRSGELKTVRLGPRGVRVHADDLERFIRALGQGTD